MSKCPFCPEELPNEEERTAHIVTRHPEKGYSAEAMAEQMGKTALRQQLNQVAAMLTHTAIVIGGPFHPKETVLETYKWFRKELQEWV